MASSPITFTQPEYLVFLLVAFILIRKSPPQWRILTATILSLLFYGSFSNAYILLIILYAGINFLGGLRLSQTHSRATLFILLLLNALFLGAFKFIPSFSRLFFSLKTGSSDALPSYIPIGVSFFTLQVAGYLIDVQRSRLRPERSFSKFLLFVSFFPQLMAGPIEKAKSLFDQFPNLGKASGDDISYGIFRILVGLIKKVVIAENLSIVSHALLYSDVENGLLTYLGLLGFITQIYTDFSGYCDIAIGSARIMGIKLTENFLCPLWATRVSEFWRRWHVTLHAWLKDYIHLPLINRRVPRYPAVILTFILSGIWHGSGLNFAVWGFMVSLTYIIQTAVLRLPGYPKSPGRVLSLVEWFTTFHFFLFTSVFFYAPNMRWAISRVERLSTLFEYHPESLNAVRYMLPFLLLLVIFDALQLRPVKVKFWWLKPACASVLVSILIYLGTNSGENFLYFAF